MERGVILAFIHLPRIGNRQEEQSLLDLVSAVASLRSLNELLEIPSESCKICGFGQLRRMTNSPPHHISCQLVVPWWISSWILMTGFSLPLACVRRFRSCFSIWGSAAGISYQFEGEDVTKAKVLNRVTELVGLRS